jgi:hypothetical protein
MPRTPGSCLPDQGQAGPADERSVAAALAGAARLGGYFEIAGGEPPGSWQLAQAGYRQGLPGLVSETGQAIGAAEIRVAASTLHLGLAARLWSAPLACALRHGIVPDLGQLRLSGGLPLRLWLPPAGGWRGRDDRELASLLRRVVLTGQLVPLAAGLHGRPAAGLLCGNAASALVGSLIVLTGAEPQLAARARQLADLLLAAPELAGAGTLTGAGLAFRRSSCCLYYRVPGGGLCGDCSLRAD